MARTGYQVLARKWRPKQFDEVVGQRAVVRTLANALEQSRLAHAYCFSGIRGVGKTTIARLLAKGLNCHAVDGPTATPCGECASCEEIMAGRSIDVFERDAASDRGINEMKELLEIARYAPARDRYKVMILDEAHMLTPEASNALLKVLEEPPEYIVFALATTEPNKILPTILSRCQHYPLGRISQREIDEHLSRIATAEQIDITADSVALIATAADGSLRDAQSLLDKLIAFAGNSIDEATVVDLLGLVDRVLLARAVDLIAAEDVAGVLGLVNEMVEQGVNLHQFTVDLIGHVRNLLVVRTVQEPGAILHLPAADLETLGVQAQGFEIDDLDRAFSLLAANEYRIKMAEHPRYHVEVTLARLARMPRLQPIQELVAELLDGDPGTGDGGTGGSQAGGAGGGSGGAGNTGGGSDRGRGRRTDSTRGTPAPSAPRSTAPRPGAPPRDKPATTVAAAPAEAPTPAAPEPAVRETAAPEPAAPPAAVPEHPAPDTAVPPSPATGDTALTTLREVAAPDTSGGPTRSSAAAAAPVETPTGPATESISPTSTAAPPVEAHEASEAAPTSEPTPRTPPGAPVSGLLGKIQAKLGQTHPLVAQSLGRTCGIDLAGEALVFRFPPTAGLFADRFRDPEIKPALRAACEAALGRSVAPRVEIDPHGVPPERTRRATKGSASASRPPAPVGDNGAAPPFDDAPHPAEAADSGRGAGTARSPEPPGNAPPTAAGQPTPAGPELRRQIENEPVVKDLLTELKGTVLSVEEL